MVHKPVLVIACGALAREITDLKRSYGWSHLRLKCLDARLHNRPGEIPARVREAIREGRPDHEQIFVAYADCGTGGALDRVVEQYADLTASRMTFRNGSAIGNRGGGIHNENTPAILHLSRFTKPDISFIFDHVFTVSISVINEILPDILIK